MKKVIKKCSCKYNCSQKIKVIPGLQCSGYYFCAIYLNGKLLEFLRTNFYQILCEIHTNGEPYGKSGNSTTMPKYGRDRTNTRDENVQMKFHLGCDELQGTISPQVCVQFRCFKDPQLAREQARASVTVNLDSFS